MPGRAAVCRPANFCLLLFGEPFWNGGGLRKTRSQLRLNFLLLFPARKRLFGTGLHKKFANTILLGPRDTAVCFFVRVPLRNALVIHVSTQTRAGIGDLRAWQSQEESLLHGLAKFRGLNRRAKPKAGESLVLTDGENCVQRISSELIAVSLSPKFPLIPHFLHRYG